MTSPETIDRLNRIADDYRRQRDRGQDDMVALSSKLDSARDDLIVQKTKVALLEGDRSRDRSRYLRSWFELYRRNHVARREAKRLSGLCNALMDVLVRLDEAGRDL